MNAVSSEQLDRVFSALAHPVRRAILEQCGSRQRTVVELAEPHAMSLNAISKHIKKLESAGLIERRLDGNFHRISIDVDTLQTAIGWLSYHQRLWGDSLMALKKNMEQGV